jgi:hypothetical protein
MFVDELASLERRQVRRVLRDARYVENAVLREAREEWYVSRPGWERRVATA